jgi:hypothetical protein
MRQRLRQLGGLVIRPVRHKFSVELVIHVTLAVMCLLYVIFLSGAPPTILQ